ncbi:MAG: DUF5106 domain-containing protein [Rikenellaceae bacterium]|nr:DUF5106 domain-containing protein [Rikenellaceae bacterium]
MKNLKIATIAITVFALAACAGNNTKKQSTQTAATTTQTQPRQIPLPELPGFINSQQQATEYMAEHYWDRFDFADTTYIDTLKTIETAFAQYGQVLASVSPELANKAMKRTMTAAQKNKQMFDEFAAQAEKYLYDPNSPVKNEEAYIGALEVMSTTSLYDEWERVRPQSQLTLALKNRLGTRATDFGYVTKTGSRGTLYGIRAKYTLLFINNPGCPACKETREQISASAMLTDLINQGIIKVLAVYPDEDLKEWYDYQPNMPENWINSYDKALAMRDKELYDLRAIPTLYLLDENKTVLLKDCMSIPTIEQVIYYRDYYNQQQ